MISSPKDGAEGLFVVALVIAVVSIAATVKRNQEIAERRLVDPVEVKGILLSSRCTTTTFTRGQSPIVVLEYGYESPGAVPVKRILKTIRGFDTDANCKQFELGLSRETVLWYERGQPGKASLYRTEDDTWGFLFLLFPAAIFLIWGISSQPSINKPERKPRRKRTKKS